VRPEVLDPLAVPPLVIATLVGFWCADDPQPASAHARRATAVPAHHCFVPAILGIIAELPRSCLSNSADTRTRVGSRQLSWLISRRKTLTRSVALG
jgi:hypothetical protein